MSDTKKFLYILAAFLAFYFLPADAPRVQGAAAEALAMLHEYARQHVLLCLVPAFFIAGAITVFVSQQSVLRYLGAQANRAVAYTVASLIAGLAAVQLATGLVRRARVLR